MLRIYYYAVARISSNFEGFQDLENANPVPETLVPARERPEGGKQLWLGRCASDSVKQPRGRFRGLHFIKCCLSFSPASSFTLPGAIAAIEPAACASPSLSRSSSLDTVTTPVREPRSSACSRVIHRTKTARADALGNGFLKGFHRPALTS